MKLLPRIPAALILCSLGTGLLFVAPPARSQSTPELLTTTDLPAKVRSVRGMSEPTGPVIEILSDHPIVPQIRRLDNPPRLVIDLPNATLASKRPDFRSTEVNAIRADQFQQSPPIARIVVDLAKPVAFTWDAAGNRLMVRLQPAPEAAKSAPATQTHPSTIAAAPDSKAAIILANTRVPDGSSVTAGLDPSVLRLERGGEVKVCPGTTVSVTSSQNGRALMLGMSTGALEAHYALDASADSIVTPDFRILLAGPGEFDYGISADSRGDTCIQALPGNTASVIVSELLGDGTYQVKPTEQVVFHSGQLRAVDRSATAACGCPAPAPAQLIASARPPETAPLPPSKPNAVHIQIDAPFFFNANDPPPPPTHEARLLPPSTLTHPTALDPAALPPPPPPTPHRSVLGKIRRFFAAIFS